MTEKTRRRGIRALWIVSALALAGFLTMTLIGGGDANADADQNADQNAEDRAEGKDAAVPVEIVELATGPIAAYITATANLVPENEVTVHAEAEGRITQLAVDEGDSVAAGALLAAIDPSALEIALTTAEIKASDAGMAFERARRTFEQDLISQEALDGLKLANQVAQQELTEARWQLDKARVRAPFRGRVVGRTVQPGQHVAPGDELFRVADFDPLIARIYLPEADVLGLAEGQSVRIALKADRSLRFTGRIQQISPVVDTSTGTVKVTVAAVEPPAAVRPGAFVTVDIVREERAEALLVPREAVVRELQKAYVYVAAEDRAEKRPVSLGLEESGRMEVVSGLAAGESVVVAGQGSLKDGAAIKILAEPAAAGA